MAHWIFRGGFLAAVFALTFTGCDAKHFGDARFQPARRPAMEAGAEAAGDADPNAGDADEYPDEEVSWQTIHEAALRDAESGERSSSRESGRGEWRGSSPSDSLPSRTGRWGRDRRMPSDSMPSRTERWDSEETSDDDASDDEASDDGFSNPRERWGRDRQMPSDSIGDDELPSRSERWGNDRRMPSDSMPSDSFRRDPLPSESDE